MPIFIGQDCAEDLSTVQQLMEGIDDLACFQEIRACVQECTTHELANFLLSMADRKFLVCGDSIEGLSVTQAGVSVDFSCEF